VKRQEAGNDRVAPDQHARRPKDALNRCPWLEGTAPGLASAPGRHRIQVAEPALDFVIDLYRWAITAARADVTWADRPRFGARAAGSARRAGALRECSWATAMRFSVRRGLAQRRLSRQLTEEREKLQSYMIFVVATTGKCDFLFQC